MRLHPLHRRRRGHADGQHRLRPRACATPASTCGAATQLCAWKLERGDIKRVPTWNEGDSGVELDGTDIAIEQLSPVDSSDGTCIEFTLVANVDDERRRRAQRRRLRRRHDRSSRAPADLELEAAVVRSARSSAPFAASASSSRRPAPARRSSRTSARRRSIATAAARDSRAIDPGAGTARRVLRLQRDRVELRERHLRRSSTIPTRSSASRPRAARATRAPVRSRARCAACTSRRRRCAERVERLRRARPRRSSASAASSTRSARRASAAPRRRCSACTARRHGVSARARPSWTNGPSVCSAGAHLGASGAPCGDRRRLRERHVQRHRAQGVRRRPPVRDRDRLSVRNGSDAPAERRLHYRRHSRWKLPSDPQAAYRAYGPALVRKAERILRSREDAVDVVHALFVDLIPRWNRDVDLPYLYRAVTNRCLNLLRDRGTRARLLEREQPAPRRSDACGSTTRSSASG